jgi:LPS export ABC transporter protein LptC
MSSHTDAVQSFENTQAALRRARIARSLIWVLLVALVVGVVALLISPYFSKPVVVVDDELKAPPELPEQFVGKDTRISGLDKNDLPYEIGAIKSVQDKANEKLIHLDTVDGTFRRATGTDLAVTSKSGRYDRETKKLMLEGSVVIAEPQRFKAQMEKAEFDVTTRTLASKSSPVDVELEQGTIKADSLVADNNGERMLFKGRVKAHFPPSSAVKNETTSGGN